MESKTIVAQGLPQKHDTRRSWRAMRKVVVWFCSCAAAFVGFTLSYSEFGPGDSQTKITEFESSLTDYISAEQQAGDPKISEVNLDDFNPFVDAQATHVGVESDVDAKYERMLRAGKNLNYANRGFANERIKHAVADFNWKASGAIAAALPVGFAVVNEDWEIKNPLQVVLKCSGIAAASAVGAGIAAWLLVVALALVWWFFTDRLRDIARAIRG